MPANNSNQARGFFGIGAEGISKPLNLGNLMRSAQAFGASFAFTVDAHQALAPSSSDTSKSQNHLPYYAWASAGDMVVPQGCALVGIEFIEGATDLPSFRHPASAVYVLGPERGSLSPQMLARCDHIVKVPTIFCINLAMAGAIVMYDRVRVLGRHAPRPVAPGGPGKPVREHLHGAQLKRRAPAGGEE
ncbi:MAG: RNA methyltransferase [Alphaproteobacteria bacterium]